MRYLLFVPALVFFLMPVLSAIHSSRAEAKRQREAAAAKAAREEAAAKIRAQREAEKAAKKAEAAAQPKRKRGRPRKQPQETPATQRPETIPAPSPAANLAPVPEPAPQPVAQAQRRGNDAFAGQTVAFTGTLPGMTRREAIAAVQANGGRAFEDMPAGTTMLVVGENPGMRKLDKADEWITTCRKITPAQFADMLKQPLSLELDDAAAFIRAHFAQDNTCKEALS